MVAHGSPAALCGNYGSLRKERKQGNSVSRMSPLRCRCPAAEPMRSRPLLKEWCNPVPVSGFRMVVAGASWMGFVPG